MRYNNNIKGIKYIIYASLCFSIMSSCIKILLDEHSVIEIIFLRSCVAICILIPLLRFRVLNLKKTYFKFHFFRTILGLSAMFFTFTALKHVPLSNVTIINFSKVFFIIPLAVLFLKEDINVNAIFYILLGFFGVMITIGVELQSKSDFIFYIYALIGAFLMALVKIFIKKISYIEKSLHIQFWFSFLSCLFLIIPYLLMAKYPSWPSILFIIIATIFGLLAQFFTIEGLRVGKSTIVMPFDFFRVIFASIIGISIFSENITLLFILGSSLILITGIQLSKMN
ncbi:MAG: hypothetical protein CMP36_03390 [Rickettsiales bacterium]|nr:hypothetical protein [Rickettsiales bacterium]OUV79043.1 MAG: hypothetical protein CBC91_04145 [Rickettsiales bacterium TMED131]